MMSPNEDQPPLPQPMRNTCHKCGSGWNENTPFCPQCGAAHTEQARHDASPGVMVVYGCAALILGTFGLLLAFAMEASDTQVVPNWSANVLLGLFLFCLWKFFRGGN